MQAALVLVGAALEPLAADIAGTLDPRFGHVAMSAMVWAQGCRAVCRVKQRGRLMPTPVGKLSRQLHERAFRLQPQARVQTQIAARKGRQPCPKL